MRFTGGLPETACGYGSTMAATESVRAELPRLLSRLGVRVLLDAPCGDFNWMRHVDLGGIEYIGCDLSDANLATARAYADKDFRRLDIVAGSLPKADAMLCRDFYQHLPNLMVKAALATFVASGVKWLIATSHDSASNASLNEIGGFNPINLTRAPFGLPDPYVAIDDGPGRVLGLWDRIDVLRSLV